MKQLIDGVAPIAILALFIGALWAGHALFVPNRSAIPPHGAIQTSIESVTNSPALAREKQSEMPQ